MTACWCSRLYNDAHGSVFGITSIDYDSPADNLPARAATWYSPKRQSDKGLTPVNRHIAQYDHMRSIVCDCVQRAVVGGATPLGIDLP